MPRERRRAADPWADRTGPADLPEPRRDGVLEPQANGYANGTGGPGLEAYRSDPYRSEAPRPEPPRADPPRPEGYGAADRFRVEPEEQRNGRPAAADHPGLRREPDAGPEPPRRRRNTGPLPPPGLPADRPRAAAPEPPGPPPGPALGPPPGPAPASPTGPLPTSPDLGVRSLSAGDLPGRRPGTSGAPGRPAASGSYAERAGTAPSRRGRESRDDGPGSLPPAPAGGAEDVRLSIFEDLQSEWFTRRDDAPPAASWQTPADDGWRAAARLAEPATAGTTTAGLPRRRPQALYVPGTAGGEAVDPGSTPNGAATRSPQDVRGRLSSYRDGVRRGRHAEPPED